jgi:hypothetical protein
MFGLLTTANVSLRSLKPCSRRLPHSGLLQLFHDLFIPNCFINILCCTLSTFFRPINVRSALLYDILELNWVEGSHFRKIGPL